jgi:hypothetical protein
MILWVINIIVKVAHKTANLRFMGKYYLIAVRPFTVVRPVASFGEPAHL